MTEQQETEFPPTWPGVVGREQQPGMTITGKLVDARVVPGRNNKTFTVVDLEKSDGAVESVPAWHWALDTLLNDLEPQIGTELTIKFEGTKSLDSGNDLRLYSVNGRSVGVGSGGGRGRKPSWLGGQTAASDDVPIEPTSQPVAATSQVAAADDDDLPFLWRPGSYSHGRKTHFNPFAG